MATDKRLALLKNANKLFRQGKTDAAIKEYLQILAIKPDDLEVRRIVGDLQLRQNNTRGAIEQFDRIADYYLKEGFYAKAIAMYKRITRVDPNYEEALFKLADLYTKQGLVMEAKQIYLDMAEECKRQNNQKKALGMYKKILEFDRYNIKMRILLADNYLKEGMKDNAVEEYASSADILISKKEYPRAEELLLNILNKVRQPKLIEKLLACYTAQNDDDKAIDLLAGLGAELFNNINLLKLLGELYLKKNRMAEAEKIFIKIAEVDPEETEVIMRLGKVYLQREEFDKTYQLFLPVVEKNINDNKFEEAASLLRFIIATNNSYLPALTKLASIFKLSGKTNNLIALYESLLPVYERKGMKAEIKGLLEELIQLSDTPYAYEEQLDRLNGQSDKETEEEEAGEREGEFVSFNLRVANDALKVSDYEKAVNILLKAKTVFPRNIELRKKLFEVCEALGKTQVAVEEGKALLDLYKELGMRDEYTELFDKLTILKPDDDKILEISGEEKTSIDIDFQGEEVAEELDFLGGADIPDEMEMKGRASSDADLLLLSEDQSLPATTPSTAARVPTAPAPTAPTAAAAAAAGAQKRKELSKSLSTYLSELDFYINDGYLNEAEKLALGLKKIYPGNKDLAARIDRMNKAKAGAAKPVEPEGDFLDLEVDMMSPGFGQEEADDRHKEHTEFIFPPLSGPEDAEEPLGMEMPHFEPLDGDQPPLGDELDIDAPFQIESSISEESQSFQEYTDSKVDLKPGNLEPPTHIKVKKGEPGAGAGQDVMDFEIEVEEPTDENELPMGEIDKDLLIQSPSVSPREKSGDFSDSRSSSGIEDLDLDDVMMQEGDRAGSDGEAESPFKEIGSAEMAFDSEEDLLEGEALFLEEPFYELEKNSLGELEAIAFWLKEVEKQRTSTIEKNMMEIFDEFKKGVDEKIGHEDYDTRYNLGIAYKEMGLLEEAIHEFLISSRHPAKFFDSAGLLGLCFREKGMFGEAVSWFERALEAPGRKNEEYLAVKYELVVTYKSQEDYVSAKRAAEDILRVNQGYRNIVDIYEEIKRKRAV
ncbi:MAG: tetratricopeptide repeat protein [Candidatus Aminicenantes bacterium]|nr:tetratricopeptide repeat protein [Candidatus Aminicenantes bacterium]